MAAPSRLPAAASSPGAQTEPGVTSEIKMNWHQLPLQDCFIPFNLVSSPAWMSTALVMDFCPNARQQPARGAEQLLEQGTAGC